MNNDLISRQSLKEATKTFVDCDGFNPVWQIIDNTPTENAISIEESYERYSKGYLRGYERGKAEAIPQGEWEEPFVSNGKTYHKCNHCHISSELILFDNFCPNCGANMKGGVTSE